MLFKANMSGNALQHATIFQTAGIASLAIGLCVIAYNFGQKNFYDFFPFYMLSMAGYFIAMIYKPGIKFILFTGIVIRIMLVMSFPNLSDDIYRFYWDGSLTLAGISPYGILPADAVQNNIPHLTNSLFSLLNSQNYYTVYPPLAQLYYVCGAWAGDVYSASVVMKSFFLMTEIAGFYFLLKLLKLAGVETYLAGWYILNPLVLIEGIGNLHFEVIMVSFLIIAMYYLFSERWMAGAGWMAVSIGVKLLPLMILPYFFFRWRGTQRWRFFIPLSIVLCLIFIPMMRGMHFFTFLSSIDLYFQKFEFNGSFYYLLRHIGQLLTGYNIIKYLGPGLGVLTIVYNLYKAGRSPSVDIRSFTLYALQVWTVYLLLATTVHPWYLISLVFFCVLTPLRYPLWWSGLVILTYTSYSGTLYYENISWIFFEYLCLFVFIFWEWRTSKHTLQE